MSKNQMGYCHICGKYGKLSFEHIPPEDALNNNRAKLYTGDEALKKNKGEFAKYQNQQKGMGKYTLCESCNNNTGSWYANAYSGIAREVAYNLHKNYELTHGNVVTLCFKNFPTLQFVKQVITMFCSLLPLSEVQRLGFDKLLLNKESNSIDKSLFDLRMYLTSINARQLMIGPCVAIYKTEFGSESSCISDLCAYPFGFILNLSPEHHIEYGTSIMNLLDAEYNNAYDMQCTLMCLERINEEFPLPLQFKSLPKT